MRSRLAGCALAVSMIAAARPAAAAGIADFAWMAGCWETSDAQSKTEEQWMRPAGGAMQGVARVTAGGRTVFTEFVQVEEEAGGLVMTVALGIGQPPVAFTRIPAGADEVVFENKAHDFPQRVRYRRQGDARTLARIEGTENGQEKGEDYPYTRVPCP